MKFDYSVVGKWDWAERGGEDLAATMKHKCGCYNKQAES
jgi:hypothetical protein